MTEVLDWPRDNPTDVAARAVQHLQGGNLVVIPTDTTYAVLAHGASISAVTRTTQLTGQRPAIGLADPLDVKNWLPNLSVVGARLARHCWPGPLTLQSGEGAAAGHCQRLPSEVQNLLMPDGLLSLRSPGHVALTKIAEQLEGPLLLAELPGAFRVEDVLAHLGQEPVLILNDGPCYFGQLSSVILVEGKSWTETRPGVLPRDIIAELVQCRILFVCTGNTCRSPLAMALCRVLLARHLGCAIDELSQRGFQVHSAGLAAMLGEMASPEAIEVVQEMGGDLLEHRSQPLTTELMAQADRFFTMTIGHMRMLHALYDPAGPEPCLLSPTNSDIPDPIGYDIEVYRQTARQIMDCLEERLPSLLES